MFGKLLVANRGEIALRIIEVARAMGVRTVAVYSEADANSLHRRAADEAYLIGEARPEKSYLNIEKIIEVAKKAEVDAVHPGYGFLSENADFAQACEEAGIAFVGPRSETVRMLGDKARARKLASDVGVPVIPGTVEPIRDEGEAREAASQMGYPVLIKAVAGGGGKAMRIVRSPDEMNQAFRVATEEAKISFGIGGLYIEKMLSSPRHIEVQILADSSGNIIHLFERECSVQRRYQKLIEETPCVILSAAERSRITEWAKRIAEASGYLNAGTFEFLRDGEGNFYFLEANCRLQVEYTVTEIVTGVNIIKQQILIASGERIPYKQDEVRLNGHAIEVRVYAEDPFDGFRPSVGRVSVYKEPGLEGLRIDTALSEGSYVSPYYDPLIAKVVVWASDRRSAIGKMRKALAEYRIEGVTTTIPYSLDVLSDERFLSGRYDTMLVEEALREKTAAGQVGDRGTTPVPDGDAEEAVIEAIITGTVVSIEVEVGEEVREGEPVCVIEAMKMYNVIESPLDGVVKEIVVRSGETVERGAILIRLSRSGCAVQRP